MTAAATVVDADTGAILETYARVSSELAAIAADCEAVDARRSSAGVWEYVDRNHPAAQFIRVLWNRACG